MVIELLQKFFVQVRQDWRKLLCYSSTPIASSALAGEVSLWVRVRSLVFMMMLCCWSASTFGAGLSDNTTTFDIPQQRADLALIAFAEQADQTLLFSFKKAKTKTANRLVGKYKVVEALEFLLMGTGLSISMGAEGQLSVVESVDTTGESIVNKRKSIWGRIGAALAGLVLSSGGAVAEEVVAQEKAQSAAIEEIVVTAQRRAQSLQDVPIAITVFGADDIADSDLTGFDNIQFQVPGLTYAATALNAQLTMRGVGLEITGLSGEPGLALNIDGVYQPRSFIGSAAYADLERIEVLHGPQGTLYGRNAIGGAINLWTKTPSDEFGGEFSLLAGNWNRVRARGAVNVPVSEDFAVRASFVSNQRDGSRRNLTTGKDADDRDNRSARIAARWDATDDLEVIFRVDWSRDDDGGPTGFFVRHPQAAELGIGSPVVDGGGQTTDDPQRFRNDVTAKYDRELVQLSNTVTWRLHDLPLFGEVELKSITAYLDSEWTAIADGDGTDLNFLNTDIEEMSETWSQEVTLGSAGDGRLNWVVGGYYFSDDGAALYRLPAPGLGLVNIGFQFDQETVVAAGFGQGTYDITDRLRFTAGIRYSYEKKEFDQNAFVTIVPGLVLYRCAPSSATGVADLVPQFTPASTKSDDTWHNWTPKLALDYDLAENVLIYGSATRGYKAGGINAGGCLDDYDQESLDSYEVGIKSEWLDGRLRLNMVAYLYDYEDFQANRATIAGQDVENASDAEVRGFELEMTALPLEGLEFRLGLSVSDAEFEDYFSADPYTLELKDLKGNNLPRSPTNSFFVLTQYTTPLSDLGTLTFRHEYSYSDNYYMTAFNETFSEQESFSMNNARVIFRTEGGRLENSVGDLEIHLFVKNWGDEDILALASDVGLLGGSTQTHQDPRSYGLEMRYNF